MDNAGLPNFVMLNLYFNVQLLLCTMHPLIFFLDTFTVITPRKSAPMCAILVKCYGNWRTP